MIASPWDALRERIRTELNEEATSWRRVAREAQRPPKAWRRIWYIRGGRGSGKTRTGAETLAELIRTNEPGEWAIIGPTYGDGRDTCVEGQSGILAAFGTSRAEVDARRSRYVETWNRSLGELRLRSGAVVWVDGADDGANRIQGKNLRGAWCDEIGLWKRATKRRGRKGKSMAEHAWDESLRFAVRMAPAKLVVTGTPKQGHPIVARLLSDARVVKTRMTMRENIDNLDPELVAELEEEYAGTRLGRQELEGDDIAEIDGALWTLAQIDEHRVSAAPTRRDLVDNAWVTSLDFRRVVVAVDPSASEAEDEGADEAGVVIVGLGHDGEAYVLADRSGIYSPLGWAQAALKASDDFGADRIVAEKNNGGAMVSTTIRTVRANASVKLVSATRGKQLRAEPVQALYEQGKVHHVGALPKLEDQMISWTDESGWSPDRMDALVWALTELMLGGRRTGMRFAA